MYDKLKRIYKMDNNKAELKRGVAHQASLSPWVLAGDMASDSWHLLSRRTVEPFKNKNSMSEISFVQWQYFSASKRSHCPTHRMMHYAKPHIKGQGFPQHRVRIPGSYAALTELSYLNTNWLNPRTSSSPLQWAPLNYVGMTWVWGRISL